LLLLGKENAVIRTDCNWRRPVRRPRITWRLFTSAGPKIQ